MAPQRRAAPRTLPPGRCAGLGGRATAGAEGCAGAPGRQGAAKPRAPLAAAAAACLAWALGRREGSRPRRAGRGGEAPGGAAPCSPRPAGGRLRDASLPLRGGSRRRGRGRPPPAAAGHARTSRLRPRPRQTPEPTRPGRSPPGRRRRPRLHGSGLQLPHSRPWTMGNQLAPLPAFLPPLQALHVVVVGLDAAGKTSLLYRLKFQEFVQSVPTKGFNMEKIRVLLGGSRAITFQVWDVGGQEKLRPLWKSYTRCTDGLVFVVDSTEAERLEEARAELHKIARTSDNQGVPVLVLANKQDVAWALSVSEVEKALSLQELGTATLSHVQGCSALSGLGLQQGLEKLYEMILQRKKLLRSSKKRC